MRSLPWPRLSAPKSMLASSILTLAAGLSAAFADLARAGDCQPGDSERRTVMRVLDGETLLLDGGSQLRLAGSLAPRAFDGAAPSVGWPAAERAHAALEALVGARTVVIAAAGRRTDRYGRLLAQAFIPSADGASEAVWVQGEMLKSGWARAYAGNDSTGSGNAPCVAALVAHEAVARAVAAGLWSEPAYAVRSAEDIASLLRLAGTFQVVEGRALRVAEVRGALYVNFGEDQRQDFTIVLRDRAVRAAAAAGISRQSVDGRQVRVRGWIERRGGPLIEVYDPAMIEVLAEAEAGAAVEPRIRRRRRTSSRP